jgi:hypothetical protein
VWQIYENRLDWFQLMEDEYIPAAPDERGVIRSRVFPGLCLDVKALLGGDFPGVLDALRTGLEGEEHRIFAS